MTPRIEHIPCDMTVTADARVTLAGLLTELGKGGQWLPLDPPSPATTTMADLISRDLNGPRRFGYGTVRDYVIGLTMKLADGRTVKSGGKVVKNVAGYDLQKLFIGAQGTLGEIVDATFKVRPKPQAEEFLQKPRATLGEAGALVDAVLESPLTPVILDLHNVNTNNFAVVLGFDGSREDVAWQIARAHELGFTERATLDYDALSRPGQKLSVLPSKLIESIEKAACKKFVARAGNGIIYHDGAPAQREAGLPVHLWQRAKSAFDPKGIFTSLS